MRKLNAALVLIALSCLWVTPVRAAELVAKSAAYADVKAAVDAAQPGETVRVPAGKATWDNQLVITKGIILNGAGADKTIIIGNMGASNYMVVYAPANPVLNEPFRLTGFTFDANNNAMSLRVTCSSVTPITKFRIDHNNFINCGGRGASFIFTSIYGVIDNNTFSGSVHIDNYGHQKSSWINLSFSYGTSDNLYYEDNVFNSNTTLDSGGWGGRYCKRYNDYHIFAQLNPLFDAHGNMPSGVYTTMGVELYGNKVFVGSYSFYPFLDHRGGKALLFFNKVDKDKASTRVREEHEDELSPPILNPIDGTPQHVNNAYYWNNRANNNLFLVDNDLWFAGNHNGTNDSSILSDSGASFPAYNMIGRIWVHNITDGSKGQLTAITKTTMTVPLAGGTDNNWDFGDQYTVEVDCSRAIAENSEYFNHNIAFNGTTGLGCGPLANRPATGAPGVGYWAMDQDCTTISDDNIGANPKTPISGTLYRAKADGTWEEYYIPYTYPHPLRTSGSLADSPLTITSPNGTEIWPRGQQRNITWVANGVTGNLVIELLQNGSVAGLIASGVNASAGTYAWTVGRLTDGTTITGTNLKIRISTMAGAVLAEMNIGSK